MLAFFIAQDEWGVFRKSWTVALLVFLAISNLGIYQYQSIQSQQGRLLTKAEYEQPTPFISVRAMNICQMKSIIRNY